MTLSEFPNLWCVSAGMCLIFWSSLFPPSCQLVFQSQSASQYLSFQGNIGEILGAKGEFVHGGWSETAVEAQMASRDESGLCSDLQIS